ncbi:MAG: type VI secretion system-associated FHA domain protein [Steroidobacteraceae bacterium]
MALRLTVVSDQRDALGRDASIVLGVGGGSIGRAHDNDWVLPDAQCYLSAHHARVQFRNGSYYLLDSSTNGTYVNGGSVPISRRNIYPLRDGDSLRLGQYEISVNIDPDGPQAPEAPEASSIFSVNASSAGAGAYAGDIGVSLDVKQLLHASADPGSGSRIGPVDAFGQSVSVHSLPIEDSGLRAFDRNGQRAGPGTDSTGTHDGSGGNGGNGGYAATVVRPERQPAGRHGSTDSAALEALCRGAGLDPRRLPLEVQPGLQYLAGVLLREALAALKGLALAQRELREHNRLEVGREDTQHIGLTGLPVEDLLLRLLLGHSRHELDAVQWLRNTAASNRGHELALMRALPAALTEFVARLDPVALSHSAAEAAASAGEAAPTGVTARFRTITEMPSGRLPQLFAEAFARAFAAEYKRNAHNHPDS